MVETNYRWKGMTLPKAKQNSIDDYVMNGTSPGHFLEACLANDLRGAYYHADSWSFELIPVIVAYIYNRVPMVCCGDKETVKNWKGMESFKDERQQRIGTDSFASLEEALDEAGA
jgi:hypothetical protein